MKGVSQKPQKKTKKTPLRDRRSSERKAPSVISLLENKLSDILLPNAATTCDGSCRSKEKPRSFHSLKNRLSFVSFYCNLSWNERYFDLITASQQISKREMFGLWRCHKMAGERLVATMKACFQSRQNVCQQEEQSSRRDLNIFL